MLCLDATYPSPPVEFPIPAAFDKDRALYKTLDGARNVTETHFRISKRH